MTNEEFQRWLAGVEQLTTAQRERLQQVAQKQGDEAAALAAIELRIDERRRCPRCRASGTACRGSRCRCGWPRPAGAGRRARSWRRPARRTCRRRRKPLRAPDAVLVTDGGRAARADGQRLRGSHPIQTVNQRHRQLQQFLLPFHGVATKCLGNHLRWHREIGLASQPSPRACLLASLALQCTRFAN